MRNGRCSKRQESWKRYQYLCNQQKNLSFMCQCGKKYVNFPGLYLHCQKKHQHKISTKFHQDQCEVIQQGAKIIYKYLISMKLNERENQETFLCQKQYLSSVLSKFHQQLEQTLLDNTLLGYIGNLKQMSRKILSDFQNFIYQKLGQTNQMYKTNYKEILENIPNYLNDFMEKSEQQSGTLQYKHTCLVLFKMCQWLKKYGYTGLVVQLLI